MEKMKRNNLIKTFTMIFIIMISAIILFVVGYVVKMAVEYYRIDEIVDVTSEIQNNQSKDIEIGKEYSITTYNIGFGAYTREFSFFLDSGEMLDGTKVTGKNSTAKDKQTVLDNTNGAISIIKALNPDFAFFQEVDREATRSHFINQYGMLQNNFSDYGSSFVLNFHSSYLLYPFNDPHGRVQAGIATFSKYNLHSSIRYSLPIDEAFFTKFFDLDRCIMMSRIKVGDKELVLINVHLSAYDKGGLIREKQLQVLNTILQEEQNKENYVIIGGDFNHDIADSLNTFKTTQKVPEWVYVFDKNKLSSYFTFATSNLNPTCRSTDIPYTEGVNYTVVLDGFIISNNIEKISVENIVSIDSKDVSFMYSDHNPVILKFKLK